MISYWSLHPNRLRRCAKINADLNFICIQTMNIKMDILIIFNNILHLPYTCILTIDSSFLKNKLNWDEIVEFAASLVNT